ncbi:hypothetical protein MBANPS3_000159 [Mucor bainieri]
MTNTKLNVKGISLSSSCQNHVKIYTSFASIAPLSAADKPDPKKKAKKQLAAGRVFTTAESKGKQGYQYVYIGRSRKILRSEVRKHLDNSGIDLGRVHSRYH